MVEGVQQLCPELRLFFPFTELCSLHDTQIDVICSGGAKKTESRGERPHITYELLVTGPIEPCTSVDPAKEGSLIFREQNIVNIPGEEDIAEITDGKSALKRVYPGYLPAADEMRRH